MSAVEFSCPRCSGLFQVESQHVGGQVACPLCQGVVQLPDSQVPDTLVPDTLVPDTKSPDPESPAQPAAAATPEAKKASGPKIGRKKEPSAANFAFPPGHPKAAQSTRPEKTDTSPPEKEPALPLDDAVTPPTPVEPKSRRPRDYSQQDLLPPAAGPVQEKKAAAPPPPPSPKDSVSQAGEEREAKTPNWMVPPDKEDSSRKPAGEPATGEPTGTVPPELKLPPQPPTFGSQDKADSPPPAPTPSGAANDTKDATPADGAAAALLPPGAEQPVNPVEPAQTTRSASAKSVDDILPPGVDKAADLDMPSLASSGPRSGDTAEPVVVPTDDGFVSLHDPVKTVKQGKQEREIVRLSREDKDHRRYRRQIVWWVLSVVAIGTTLFVLLKLGPIR